MACGVATNDGRLTDLPDANANITVVILKDAWRQLARRPEQGFFARIEQAIPEGKRVGLPARAIDCDLGDIEVQRWAHDSGRDLRGTIDVIHRQAPVSLPAPLPLQQTCTWRIIHGPDGVYRERSHVRTVTKTIGRSLVEFKNTRELCQAFRDAIAGHKVLFEHGILHRDISVGNLFVDDSNHLSHDSVGVLYDFDYSSMVELNTSASDKSKGLVDERNVKERKMDYFTAVRLLESPDIEHNVWHDLESFLWVLVWVVLYHTDHTHSNNPDASYLVFGDAGCTRAAFKRAYLLEIGDPLAVRNNDPLSQLISASTKLGRKSFGYNDVPPVPMTPRRSAQDL